MRHDYTIEIQIKSSDKDYWKDVVPPETGCDLIMKDLEMVLRNQTRIPMEDIKITLCRYHHTR